MNETQILTTEQIESAIAVAVDVIDNAKPDDKIAISDYGRLLVVGIEPTFAAQRKFLTAIYRTFAPVAVKAMFGMTLEQVAEFENQVARQVYKLRHGGVR
jgi:hypothetical protein